MSYVDVNGNAITIGGNSLLAGKNVCIIGDSITEHNGRAKKNWGMWLSEMTGCVVQNLGISGTGFAHPAQYVNRISSIKSPNIIGVAGSFNDLESSVTIPLGSVSDTGTSSICGYINGFFDVIKTAYPSTPIICYIQNAWGAFHPGVEKSDKYVLALKEICYNKGIPFDADMYYSDVLRPFENPLSDGTYVNRTLYFKGDWEGKGYYNMVDDTHPNSDGHRVIVSVLAKFFEANI